MLLFKQKAFKLNPYAILESSETQRINNQPEDNQQMQLQSRHKYIQNKRQIKTSQSSKRSTKNTKLYRSIEMKTPRITNQLNTCYQLKIQKLGLQDYLKNIIIEEDPQQKQFHKKKKQLILKVLNSTWIKENIMESNKDGFRGSFRQKTFSKVGQPKVQWGNCSQKLNENWKEASHISHHLFPCRQQSHKLKQRYYRRLKYQQIQDNKILYLQMNTQDVRSKIEKKLNSSLNIMTQQKSKSKSKRLTPQKLYSQSKKKNSNINDGSLLGTKVKMYQ